MSLPLLFSLTREFFTRNQIADDHGFRHAETVARNAMIAVFYQDFGKTEEINRIFSTDLFLLIVAAALLHDADDRKTFPNSRDYENARRLLIEAGFIDLDVATVIEMISYVSASHAGNTVVEPRWKLIPRDADRIEALGEIGVERCRIYSELHGRPMYTDTTPVVTNMDELKRVDVEARFRKYVTTGGTSASMIDHYYDKLLAISHLESHNSYLQEIADTRHRYMLEWVFDQNSRRVDDAK